MCIRDSFTDVGHLLGSAAIEIWLKEGSCEKKIVFSGDIGNLDQPILCDPKHIDKTDYLVIESTYGDRNHSDERPDYIAGLSACIQRTLDRGGNVVIPSFAVGRTQELLYFIRQIKDAGMVHGLSLIHISTIFACVRASFSVTVTKVSVPLAVSFIS